MSGTAQERKDIAIARFFENLTEILLAVKPLLAKVTLEAVEDYEKRRARRGTN
jgi:hypothetical protein